MWILQRREYDGVSREEAVWWTLRRQSTIGEAVCRMLTHPGGHVLHLEVAGRLLDSQVCYTDEDVLSRQEQWRAALELKGWMAAQAR